MQEKTYRVKVDSDEYFKKTPDVAVFTIGEDDARKIARLANLVKENGLYQVEMFDFRTSYLKYDPEENPEYALANGDENDIRTFADCMSVSADEFWFTAFVHNTDVELRTNTQSIPDLLLHFGIDEGTGSSPT